MTNKDFLVAAIWFLLASTITFAESFVLKDGSVIEGSIHRIEGSRVSIMSSTGVRTYDVMEFDENTRDTYFGELLLPPEEPTQDSSSNETLADAAIEESTPSPPITIRWPILDYIRFYGAFPMLIYGVLLCFFGRRFYRQLMAIAGVALGLGIGWLIAVQLLKMDNMLFSGLIMLGAATLMGFLFLTYVYLVVILFGAVFGLLAALFVLQPLGMIGIGSATISKTLLLVLPITGAILAFTHFKIMLIVATASMGSTQFVHSMYLIGVSIYKGVVFDSPEVIMPLVQASKEEQAVSAGLQIAFLAVFIIGVIFQLMQSRKDQENTGCQQSVAPYRR